MSQAAITSFLPAAFYSPILTKSQRYVCAVINSIKRETQEKHADVGKSEREQRFDWASLCGCLSFC